MKIKNGKHYYNHKTFGLLEVKAMYDTKNYSVIAFVDGTSIVLRR